ncbi:MAG: MBL fold metallo-hydrolase [Candidatus Micrarchaeota archaeon]
MDCLRYLGNMSFLLEINGTTCAINPSLQTAPPARIEKCDLIFITSEEGTCFDARAVEGICGRTYASVVAPRHILARISVGDKYKVDVKGGDRFSLKGLEINATRSVRPQSAYPVGFVISSAKWKIYYSGTTYAFADMAKIRCDIAILPIAGSQCMDAFAAANACRDLRPKYAIPIGYERAADSSASSTGEFSSGLPKGVLPIILRPGSAAKIKK